MSRLIRFFSVCLVDLFFIPTFGIRNKQGRCPNLEDCPNLPNFTLPVMGNFNHCIFIVENCLFLARNSVHG